MKKQLGSDTAKVWFTTTFTPSRQRDFIKQLCEKAVSFSCNFGNESDMNDTVSFRRLGFFFHIEFYLTKSGSAATVKIYKNHTKVGKFDWNSI